MNVIKVILVLMLAALCGIFKACGFTSLGNAIADFLEKPRPKQQKEDDE
jgi:hypothetical protein